MGILDRLMSSDPMVSAQRRGILEQLASMSGPQPIAPSMGQVFGAVSAGARQGKRDYMADEMAQTEYMTMDDGTFVKFNKMTGEMEEIDNFPKYRKPETPANYIDQDTQEKLSLTATEYNALPPEKRRKLIKFTGELSGGEIDKTATREFETDLYNLSNTDANLTKLYEVLGDDAVFTATLPKGVNNTLTSLRANLEQSFEWFSDDDETISTTGIEILDNNRDKITEIAAKSGMADSLIIVSAYSLANNLNPDGRISDKDFKAALDALIGKTSDKNAMRSIIAQNIQMNRNKAKNRINIANTFGRNVKNVTFNDFFKPFEVKQTISSSTGPNINPNDPLGLF